MKIYKSHSWKYYQEDDKDRYFKKSQFTLIYCDTKDPYWSGWKYTKGFEIFYQFLYKNFKCGFWQKTSLAIKMELSQLKFLIDIHF